jgi:hypothetical protein
MSDYLSRTDGGVWEGRSWQSYSTWVRIIAGALKWAGFSDLVLHREAAMEDMAPDAVASAQVVRLLRELCVRSDRLDKGVTAREICAEAPKAAGGLDAPTRRALLVEIKENLGLRGPEELTVRKCNTYLKSLGTTAEGKLVCKTVEGYLRWRVA